MLMKSGKNQEAASYLNDMLTEVNALSPKIVSGDDMVDSLISAMLPRLLSLEQSGFQIFGCLLFEDVMHLLACRCHWQAVNNHVPSRALVSGKHLCLQAEVENLLDGKGRILRHDIRLRRTEIP